MLLSSFLSAAYCSSLLEHELEQHELEQLCVDVAVAAKRENKKSLQLQIRISGQVFKPLDGFPEVSGTPFPELLFGARDDPGRFSSPGTPSP